jgi:YD repeat-containing protein
LLISSNEFSGSKISWNWPGWKLVEAGGRTHYFPDGGHQPPEQSALLAIEDGQGNRLNLPRDSFGNLIRAHSSGGRDPDGELDFQYDEQNRITQVLDRSGPRVDYSYDPGGRLVHVKNVDGQVTDYSYDGRNRMITVLQNESLILSNEYDAADRVIRQTLSDGRAYTFRYSLDRSGQWSIGCGRRARFRRCHLEDKHEWRNAIHFNAGPQPVGTRPQ